jgi:hypothetical protein
MIRTAYPPLAMLACVIAATGALSRELDTSRLIASVDFIYDGAFMLPRNDGSGEEHATFDYGAAALAYHPAGDANGPQDGYAGSLFGTGHIYDLLVAEVSIPAPVRNDQSGDLPRAGYLQKFASITGGVEPRLNQVRTAGLACLSGKTNEESWLFFTQGHHWMHFDDERGGRYQPTHVRASIDLSAPEPAGPWKIDTANAYTCSGFCFEIPAEWSDRFTPGKRLAAGGYREHIGSSYGPSLYAVAAPLSASTPPAGMALEATTLLNYGLPPDSLIDCKHADRWNGGAWLTIGDKSAVAIIGLKGEGRESYGVDNPLGGKGWYTESYNAVIMLYDPESLGAAARGLLKPHEIQPYAKIRLDPHFLGSGIAYPEGAAFDRKNARLYIAQRNAARYGQTAVQVFSLGDAHTVARESAHRHAVKGLPAVSVLADGDGVLFAQSRNRQPPRIFTLSGQRIATVRTRAPNGDFYWRGASIGVRSAGRGCYIARFDQAEASSRGILFHTAF